MYSSAFKACENFVPPATYFSSSSPWKAMSMPSDQHLTSWDTGCSADLLRFIGSKSVQVDEEFVSIHCGFDFRVEVDSVGHI